MRRILIIEDHDGLREQIAHMLSLSDFETLEAEDGETGVALALAELPDLILCDVMMVDMDGYGVLRCVREHDAVRATPFIFMTAMTDRDEMRRGMAMGADDYLTKPFTAGELLATVRARLNRHDSVTREAQRNLETAKRQLMHLVTHELRTPLASISMVTDIITRQVHTLAPAQIEELLETLMTGSKRLSRMVDQIVLITQVQGDMLNRQTVQDEGLSMPLWELLVASIGLARRFAYQQSNVNVQLVEGDSSAQVVCHPIALKQALAELISNALNFSPDGGSITVTQWAGEGRVWISIVDQGPGIAPDQMRRALEAFQQIDRERREQQGMGLGLGLAYHLFAAHGGHLELRSEPGVGTEALVALPLAPTPVPAGDGA